MFFDFDISTEELKAASAGTSTYSPVFHHADGPGMLLTFVLGFMRKINYLEVA